MRRPRPNALTLTLTLVLVLVLVSLLIGAGCEIRSRPALITVYNGPIGVSFPLPQGWTADAALEQAGFQMQTFTGRSVDVADRSGIRVQVMSGPMPASELDQVAERYQRELELTGVSKHALAGFEGKKWSYVSEDGDETAELMLTDVDGTLYGLYLRGETPTVEAHRAALDQMFRDFAVERGKYFDVYEAPGGDVAIRHPRSWLRTQTVASPGESLFVGFRSPALAVERDGTTVHATLEVTVNRVGPEVTVESFYAARTETLGDTYRLLDHQVLESGAISTLYLVETQLASYLERTVYAVRDGKSFIFKFNAQNQVYHAIEPWIDEIVRYSFQS